MFLQLSLHQNIPFYVYQALFLASSPRRSVTAATLRIVSATLRLRTPEVQVSKRRKHKFIAVIHVLP
jgi:hypothetical protein